MLRPIAQDGRPVLGFRQGQIFDQLVTSELSGIVAGNQIEAEVKPTALTALAKRGLAICLDLANIILPDQDGFPLDQGI